RVFGLRDRVKTELLHESYRFGSVIRGSSLWNRTKRRVAVISREGNCDVIGRNFAAELWRHEQVLSAFALVLALWSNIRDRNLPRVQNAAEESGSHSGRKGKDDRSVLQIEIEIDVE